MSVEIKLSRMDRVYHPGQMLKGVAIIHGRGSPLQHDGISLTAEGSAALQLSAKSVGLFEAFYSSIKPVQLLHHSRELQPSGKLPAEATEFAFEFEVAPLEGEKLHESYHGVFVNLQYVITVEVRRGMLAKNLKRSIEFIVEAPDNRPIKESPATFAIVPESLENVRKSALHQVPSFKIKGQLDSVVCNIAQPLTGEVLIEECSATIRSIELQLVRVETCSYQDGLAREATEIQNIQIADGPVCHGWAVPVHMVFPRLFTCPTVSTRTFKVDFEVNLVILFSDGHLLTENFPLKLVRNSGTTPLKAATPAAGSAAVAGANKAAGGAVAAPPPAAAVQPPAKPPLASSSSGAGAGAGLLGDLLAVPDSALTSAPPPKPKPAESVPALTQSPAAPANPLAADPLSSEDPLTAGAPPDNPLMQALLASEPSSSSSRPPASKAMDVTDPLSAYAPPAPAAPATADTDPLGGDPLGAVDDPLS